MKKVMFLLLVTFFCQLLFSGNNVETGKFRVSMDDTCRDPEVLMSPEGDIYFFYIKDDKLVIELKKSGINQFSIIENTFFDTALTVKSIKSFKYLNNSMCIIIKASDGKKESIEIISLDDSYSSLKHEQLVNDNEIGSLNNVKLLVLGSNKYALFYLKSNQIFYLINDNSLKELYDIKGKVVKEYNVESIFSDSFVYINGYILTTDNTLYGINVDNNGIKVTLLKTFHSTEPQRIITKTNSKIKYMYVYWDNEIYRYDINTYDLTVFINPYEESSLNSFISSLDEIIFYRHKNEILELSIDLKLYDIRKIEHYKDFIYILTVYGQFKMVDLLSSEIKIIKNSDVVDVRINKQKYNSFPYVFIDINGINNAFLILGDSIVEGNLSLSDNDLILINSSFIHSYDISSLVKDLSFLFYEKVDANYLSSTIKYLFLVNDNSRFYLEVL